MELIIFTGLQACGKSTFYKQKFVDTHVRLNLDMLRTRNREKILLAACLNAKQPVVIDNTNPTIEDRARYLAVAKAAGFTVFGYYFESKIEECKVRNSARPKKQVVPMVGILHTFTRLTRPTLAEGFDRLWYVRIEAGDFVVDEWKDERSDEV